MNKSAAGVKLRRRTACRSSKTVTDEPSCEDLGEITARAHGAAKTSNRTPKPLEGSNIRTMESSVKRRKNQTLKMQATSESVESWYHKKAYGGLDWASRKHTVCLVNAQGKTRALRAAGTKVGENSSGPPHAPTAAGCPSQAGLSTQNHRGLWKCGTQPDRGR